MSASQRFYGKINWGQVSRLLYRGCPLFGGSVIRGFTVLEMLPVNWSPAVIEKWCVVWFPLETSTRVVSINTVTVVSELLPTIADHCSPGQGYDGFCHLTLANIGSISTKGRHLSIG